MLKNVGTFFHLWIFTCLTVSGCMFVICALSVSYQQVYDSYPIICIKMHKTYKCGLTNSITQVAMFRLRMLCGFMPILALSYAVPWKFHVGPPFIMPIFLGTKLLDL